jgi:hypothetical protein
MQQRTPGNTIVSRYWSSDIPVLYVAQVPGDGGKDWGYTTDAKSALPLNKHFVRRFLADCNRVGAASRTY